MAQSSIFLRLLYNECTSSPVERSEPGAPLRAALTIRIMASASFRTMERMEASSQQLASIKICSKYLEEKKMLV